MKVDLGGGIGHRAQRTTRDASRDRRSLVKSELVKSSHVARKAVVYIRQSTPHQIVSNQRVCGCNTRCASAPANSDGMRPTSM
jgi:hypothetical protein